jgi:hypothetical protein
VLDASTEEKQIRDWWTSWPEANVAIATGEGSGLYVLDVDPPHGGDKTLAAFETKHGKLPNTVEAVTGSGGRHLLFKCPPGGAKGTIGFLPGLDIRCSGNYIVVAPSSHLSGAKYAWAAGHEPGSVELQTVPLELQRAAVVKSKSSAPAESIGSDIPEGTRNKTLASLAGTMRRRGCGVDEILAALRVTNEKRCKPPLEECELEALAKSVGRYAPAAEPEEPPHPADASPESFGALALKPVPEEEPSDTSPLHLTDFSSGHRSACRILRSPLLRERALGGKRLEFNEMGCSPELGRVPLTDCAVSAVREWIEERFMVAANSPKDDAKQKWKRLRFSQDELWTAVNQVAAESPYHPVREYLAGLTWDRVPRLGMVASELLGIHDPPTLVNTMLRRWFISTVARGLRPGCKVDTALVLIGEQGIGKSHWFSTLGNGWYVDTSEDVATRDSLQVCAKGWIVEWAELESIQRARDVETVKAHLSRQVDVYVPKYERAPRTVPRSFVLVGTTNQGTFLSDSTGNRRFWPVVCGDRIDDDKTAAWREQLWAEARAAFDAGERWWLTQEEDKELSIAQAPHEIEDPWEQPVAVWLSENEAQTSPKLITVATLLELAVLKPRGQATRADQMRVARVLKGFGYKRTRSGEHGRQWFYTRRPTS